MTVPRVIGPLRPFPTAEANALKWPPSFQNWFVESRYQTSADGLRVVETLVGTTPSNTPLVLWAYEMPINSVMITTTHIVGIKSDATKVFAVRDTTCFQRATGDAVYRIMYGSAQEGREWHESDSATALTMGISGAEVRISVTGVVSETWKWQGFCEYTVLRA